MCVLSVWLCAVTLLLLRWCVRVRLCVRVQVSEQVDSLRVLFTDPVDYLVTPRVLASMIAGPSSTYSASAWVSKHT